MPRPAGRKHVSRQQLRQLLSQVFDGGHTVRRVDVRAADEPSFEAIGLNRSHRTFPQGWDRVERCLDLAQLDPVAPALDLRVGTAEEIEKAVGAAARQIAGLINAIARTRSAGTRKKHAVGLPLVAPVARAQPGAPDVEIADIARGYGLQ